MTTKIVKHAKAVMSVVHAPMTAALVFSGTALLIHATAHIDNDKAAWETDMRSGKKTAGGKEMEGCVSYKLVRSMTFTHLK